MSRLLHISDTHFGTERSDVCEALLGLAQQLAPDVIVWSGDITQRATAAQFSAAAAFADALPTAPLLVLPGNHDLPLFALGLRLLAPYARFRSAFGADLEPSFNAAGWHITTVDTTRRWRQQNGALSAGQIQRVAARLRKADARSWRIVVTHHPLAVNRLEDLPARPWRHAQALATWSASGMDVALAGHTHVPFIEPIPASGPARHRSWLVQAGTAISRRTRLGIPNSVTLLVQNENGGPAARFAARWDYSHHERRFVERERRAID